MDAVYLIEPSVASVERLLIDFTREEEEQEEASRSKLTAIECFYRRYVLGKKLPPLPKWQYYDGKMYKKVHLCFTDGKCVVVVVVFVVVTFLLLLIFVDVDFVGNARSEVGCITLA